MNSKHLTALLAINLFVAGQALNNGLGSTPPLGFNTWNYFGCNIDETVIRTAADKLIALGLAEAGYTYLNIDDCWHMRSRSADGQLQEDPIKFPSGMAALGEDIHQRGLKFGIYSDAGLFTCAGYPGSRFHEEDDAALFASWGVDYLKYDNCFAASVDVKTRYTAMRDALNATGRPIYFSMCEWGVNEPWKWGADVGNSWRTDADIAADWDSVLRSLDNGAAGLAKYAGPGGWNDPDMLEVANGLLTPAQQRSHFALWALVKAPLLIGANLDKLTPLSLSILLAKEVIAINQDRLGVPGDIIWKEGPAEIWAAPLEHNSRAVILFNRHHAGNPIDITVTWSQLGFNSHCNPTQQDPAAGPVMHQGLWSAVWGKFGSNARPACKPFKALVRDLYAEQDLGVFEDGYTASIQNFDVAVLKISPAAEPSSSSAAQASRLRDCGRLAGWMSSSWCWTQVAYDLRCRESRLMYGADSSCGKMSDGRTQGPKAMITVTESQEVRRAVNGGHAIEPDAKADWRPWTNPAAVKLQEQLRQSARISRQQHVVGRHADRQRHRTVVV